MTPILTRNSEPDSGLHVMPQKRRKTMAAELSQSFMASMETMFQKSLGNIEVENTKLKEEIAKKNEEIVQLRIGIWDSKLESQFDESKIKQQVEMKPIV